MINNKDITLAIYDPVAKFLLWLGKCSEDFWLQKKERLHFEQTGELELNKRKLSYACRHLKTLAGAKELLSRVGYSGRIKEIRIPGKDSTNEKPTSLLEDFSRIMDGSYDSRFLRGILERHLASDILPEVYPGDIWFLNLKQRYWGTFQASRRWPEIWEDYS